MGRKLGLVAGTKPQLRKPSKRNWTKAKQVAFLSALAETCNVTQAARRAGVCASYAYKKRASDAKFRAGWIGAVAVGYQRLELELLDRAFNGGEGDHAEQTLDALVAGSVEEGPRAAPPAARTVGACYVVGSPPTGEWAGKAQSVAAFTTGGWRFVAPVEGMSLYVKASGNWATYRLGTWETGTLRGSSVVLGGQQVVGSRGGAIASANGGTTIDVQARAAIDQILAALRQHGLIDT